MKQTTKEDIEYQDTLNPFTPEYLPIIYWGVFLFSHLHYSSVISPLITEQDTHHYTIYFT